MVFPSDAACSIREVEWPTTYLILAIGAAAVDSGCSQAPRIDEDEVVAELDFDIIRYEMEHA
jgi:hypothetical protein